MRFRRGRRRSAVVAVSAAAVGIRDTEAKRQPLENGQREQAKSHRQPYTPCGPMQGTMTSEEHGGMVPTRRFLCNRDYADD